MLAFCTRLSNLPAALSTAAMALPLDVPVAAVRAPRETVARIRWSVVAGTVAGVSLALLLFALHTWYYAGVFSVTYGTSLGMHRVWQPDLPLSSGFRLMFESFGVLLTMNDPPHVSWYSIPLLAGVACVAALMGVKGVRTLPLALVLFFLGCCSMAFVVRGMAYSGRHSTHLIGAACTIVVLVVAAAFNGISRLAGLRGRID
jgi:hypothetical protein